MTNKIDEILVAALRLGVSDIHITVGGPPLMRLHGGLKDFGDTRLLPDDTEAMARSVIPADRWETFKAMGELDLSYVVEGKGRFRVNAYHQRGSIGMAIRSIPTEIPQLENLNLPEILKTIINKKQGLVLVTGPTGSGKSTTLASMINYLNMNYEKHIMTLEDPIEFLHRRNQSVINQREVGFDTKSFANGLRACLRQDPDIILVGEMRDLETISTALTAAETGHLVLGTLHTTSAVATIDRLIDAFPVEAQSQVRMQVASSLKAVISQRLLPTVGGKGRAAALEIMLQTPAISNLIRTEKIHQIQNTIETNRAMGMQTMEKAIKALVDEGKVSQEIADSYLDSGH